MGLGNPGHLYLSTWHNLGTQAVDALAGERPFDREGLSLVQAVEVASTPVLLEKPQTYMNRSGQAAEHRSLTSDSPPRT